MLCVILKNKVNNDLQHFVILRSNRVGTMVMERQRGEQYFFLYICPEIIIIQCHRNIEVGVAAQGHLGKLCREVTLGHD